VSRPKSDAPPSSPSPEIVTVLRPGPWIDADEGPLANAPAGRARATITMSRSFLMVFLRG
jgi:hypothetical protein